MSESQATENKNKAEITSTSYLSLFSEKINKC